MTDVLQNYRAGRLDRAAAHKLLTDAGWDAGDIDPLLDRSAPSDTRDRAQQFIDQQQARRKQQPNPLSRH
jgi:hypothetical protein